MTRLVIIRPPCLGAVFTHEIVELDDLYHGTKITSTDLESLPDPKEPSE